MLIACLLSADCVLTATGLDDRPQCWLKHQEDPNNPQVNMRGNYSVAYRQRHPDAPAAVQWQAGVVVRKGSAVDLSTWSSRANW